MKPTLFGDTRSEQISTALLTRVIYDGYLEPIEARLALLAGQETNKGVLYLKTLFPFEMKPTLFGDTRSEQISTGLLTPVIYDGYLNLSKSALLGLLAGRPTRAFYTSRHYSLLK